MPKSADFFISYSNPNGKELKKLEWLGSVPENFKPFDIDSKLDVLSPATYRAYVRNFLYNTSNGIFGSDEWPWTSDEKAVFQYTYFVKINKIIVRINNPNKKAI